MFNYWRKERKPSISYQLDNRPNNIFERRHDLGIGVARSQLQLVAPDSSSCHSLADRSSFGNTEKQGTQKSKCPKGNESLECSTSTDAPCSNKQIRE